MLKSEEQDLIFFAQFGDTDAQNVLVMKNLDLLKKNLQKYRFTESSTFDDLLQESVIGFIRGIQSFDLKKDYKLSTYAMYKVWSQLTRYLEYRDRIVTHGHSHQFAVENLRDNIHIEIDKSFRVVDPRDDCAVIDYHDEIVNLMDKIKLLNPYQKKVILLRFFKGMTLIRIAKKFGVSVNTIQFQIYSALKVLRGEECSSSL